LDSQAGEFDSESSKLEQMIADLEADLETVKRKHLTLLKRQAGVVANREAALIAAIEAAPELFKKPRTLMMHGVKLGYTTSQGRVEFEDADQVVKLIRRYYADLLDEFVRTKEEPSKDALRRLTEPELAKICCRIEGAGDVVVLKRVAGDIEKLISRLIDKMVAAMVETEE
jgi:phage host-nuclease inhibitor protein Gam